MNAQEFQGWTPLHSSISQIEHHRSARGVRCLLIKGADRRIEDK